MPTNTNTNMPSTMTRLEFFDLHPDYRTTTLNGDGTRTYKQLRLTDAGTVLEQVTLTSSPNSTLER